MKTIKYIGFYDDPSKPHDRIYSLSGTNKMNYISDLLIKAGYGVQIISPSWAKDKVYERQNLKYKNVKIRPGKNLILFPTIKIDTFFIKYIKSILSLFNLFFWLIKNTKKNEKILAYHSPLLSIPLLLAKKIKKFILVLEVEEIYTEVWNRRMYLKYPEHKIIKAADSYICASDLLGRRLGKESLIVYGCYDTSNYLLNNNHSNKANVSIVYAGSLDHTKGGVYKALQLMDFLNKKYTLHICGYGSPVHIFEVKKIIKELNERLGREACIFHGKLLGDDLSNLLNNCQIGLNPQNEGDYMATAFPSKILTYLSHNLHVLSTNIDGVKSSALGSYINFSRDDSALQIANGIENIDLKKKIDYYQIITELENKLLKNLKELFH